MRPLRASLVALTLAAGLPALAQAPLFVDGTVIGGSRVFSEGLSPLGNSARFDRAKPGVFATYMDGDQGANEALEGLDQLLKPETFALGLAKVAEDPWTLRTVAYGLSWAQAGGIHSSLVQEEMTGSLAYPDLDPAHLGAGLGANGTYLDLRRAEVTRLSMGAGATEGRTAYGVIMRVEYWRRGYAVQALNPGTDQLPLSEDPLDFDKTNESDTAFTMDGGFTVDIVQGIRLGTTVDRLIPRTFGDVDEKMQFRAGLQLDLGTWGQLSVEADLNKAERMPFPLKQRTTSASLRLIAGPHATLILGGERKTMTGNDVIKTGATLILQGQGWHIGAGFQFSQERPFRALNLGTL